MANFTQILTLLSTLCRAITVRCGMAVAWLTFVMAIAVTVIVALRSLWDVGAIGAQESITYMHALVIMLASAYTLNEGGHVRVDIFYQRFSPVTKAWINALGSVLFLLPVAVFIVLISWDYVMASWAMKESSADAGGLPAIFLLKTLLVIHGLLLIVQAVAECGTQLLTLTLQNPPAISGAKTDTAEPKP